MNRVGKKLNQIFSNNFGILCFIVFIFAVLIYFISISVNENSIISKNNENLFNRDIGVLDFDITERGIEIFIINNKPVEVRVNQISVNGVECQLKQQNLYVKKKTFAECLIISDMNQEIISYNFSIEYTDVNSGARYVLNDLNLTARLDI